MKIDRLLETTILLINRGSVTAAELAEHFEVSTRTVYRDIDALAAAGVPVFANRGAKGGISLMDGYALPKAIITKEERDSILFSLKTLQATKYPEIEKALEKLQALFQTTSSDWVEIDFSPWGANPDAYHKLTNIKKAILKSLIAEFDYLDAMNQRSRRRIEPLRLIYKSNAWYLWGWCLHRQDYRMFRISRIRKFVCTEEPFDRSQIKEPKEADPAVPAPRPPVNLVLRFQPQALYRLMDDYDEEDLEKNSDGSFTLHVTYPEDNWVYGYLLSFGPQVEVLRPNHVRQKIQELASQTASKYISGDGLSK